MSTRKTRRAALFKKPANTHKWEKVFLEGQNVALPDRCKRCDALRFTIDVVGGVLSIEEQSLTCDEVMMIKALS